MSSDELNRWEWLSGLPWGLRSLLAVASGALTLLAFAPFSFYPLAVLGPAVVFMLLHSRPMSAFWDGWLFGLGLLGCGVSWMHISIDQFGNVGTPLALCITLLFILGIALYYALAAWLVVRLSGPEASFGRRLSWFVPLWVLLEWVRGWFLTGFPWLSLGYSQIDSLLGGWAPVLGVYGVSLSVLLSSAGVLLLFCGNRKGRVLGVVLLLWVWGGGWLLRSIEWSSPIGEPLRVSIVQGNVPQHLKWERTQLQPTLDLYSNLTRQNWQSDLIIWPETAVPAFRHQVDASFLQPLGLEAQTQGSSLLLGIADWHAERSQYFNAMLALGGRPEIYYKQHLVPFGEFLPLKSLLQPLLGWLEIPMSDFSSGDRSRPLMTLAGYPAGISICYEDAFGHEVIKALPEAAFLVNASNDAWFGDSLALPQHLEIARMRALETERWMLRATNTGISAIIEASGRLVMVAPAFERQVLTGEIQPLGGNSPYSRAGNTPLVSLLLLSLLATGAARIRAYWKPGKPGHS